ncbi:MAG: hypothetical protein AAB268_12475 [Elusimicrobiota bacterium]
MKTALIVDHSELMSTAHAVFSCASLDAQCETLFIFQDLRPAVRLMLV